MTFPTIEELYSTGYFSGLDYHFAGTIARLGGEKNPLVVLAAALVSRFTRQGHVCLDLSAIAGKTVMVEGQDLEGCRWPGIEAWLAAILPSRLVAREVESAPLVLDRCNRLYLARYWQCQRRLAGQLKKRSSLAVADVDHDLLARGLSRLFPGSEDYPDGQRMAAETSVKRHLTVVSGGPGTGKTHTVVTMLCLIIEQALSGGKAPPRILLSAPTGKAAARLKASVAAAKERYRKSDDGHYGKIVEMIPDDAATIHRLLGHGSFNGQRLKDPVESYLPVDLLVVDEASMVDLSLMTRLMEAMAEKARLILLGDKDQLASVEAGAILGDICKGASTDGGEGEKPSIARSVVTLTRSYRFDGGGGIGRLAGAIRDGESKKALSLLGDAAYPDIVLRPLSGTGELNGRLREIARRSYLPSFSEKRPYEKIKDFNAFRILCAHRKGPDGVDAVNGIVASFLVSETGISPGRSWYPGRPVMVTRNDYSLGLFNGDIGMVLPDEDAGELYVYFEGQGEIRRIPPSRMPAHATVYAMTVHKSQGSEFDGIALILPQNRSPVVTRELLYTAVTRARSRVEIIGPERVLLEAIETPVQRASGLSEQLSES